MNLELIKIRTDVVKAIRRFFDERGFTEMLTPRLVGLPGQEPYLDPFWTTVALPLLERGSRRELESGEFPAALITSPEYAMKKLLAAGFDKIYDLGPCFRNREPWDGTHDPEFLLLEWYRKNAGLEELMTDAEEMIASVIARSTTTRQSPEIASFLAMTDKPFRRMTVADAMKQYAGIDLEPLLGNREALAKVAVEHHQTVRSEDSWDDLFFKLFLSEVEPKLGWNETKTEWQPTFLYRYPASMAALARKDPADPRYALRVELHIGDLELANGFAELADPTEQRKRFEEEKALRSKLGKKTWAIDENFLAALPAMGSAAGIAFGVDRLAMLLVGAVSINEILPFSARERFQN